MLFKGRSKVGEIFKTNFGVYFRWASFLLPDLVVGQFKSLLG